MKINLKNLRMDVVDYIDNRGYHNPTDKIQDLKKIGYVKLSCNSIDVDVLKNILKYHKNIKVRYFKANQHDNLFIGLFGINHVLIKIFKRYNTILNGLTYKEQKQLEYIRCNSYISKKYSLDSITDIEYGVYEPTNTIDYYNDYDNVYNQAIFKNKRIDYNKKDNMKQDVISKTLGQACKLITSFKLSDTNIKLNSNTLFVDIFKYRLKVCSFKLHNNYHRVKNNYDSYEEFIKYVVFYGASHHSNQRFWATIKRELY